MANPKIICLISGGSDSPVAAYLLVRKGYEPVAIYFDIKTYTPEETRKAAITTISTLSKFSEEKKIKTYIVPHKENLKSILRRVPRELTCVFCRRMMYKIAEKIAKLEGSCALVTGEIMGEQVCLTLRNLQSIDQATELPILRPLIGFDKNEVSKIGKEIGTTQTSTFEEKCCAAVPMRPDSQALIPRVLHFEKSIDYETRIDECIKNAHITWVTPSAVQGVV